MHRKTKKSKSKNLKITGYLYAFVSGNDFFGMKRNGTAVIKSLL